MFTSGTRQLIDEIVRLAILPPDEARRTLSAAYVLTLEIRFRTEDATEEDVVDAQADLSRLIAAFEAAVLLDDRIPADLRTASAFVAAEAAFLLSELSAVEVVESAWEAVVQERLRSGLLYLIAEQYPNARQAAAGLDTLLPTMAQDARSLVGALSRLLNLEVSQIHRDAALSTELRGRALAETAIVVACQSTLAWLAYASDEVDLGPLSTAEAALSGTGVHGPEAGLIRLVRLALLTLTRAATRGLVWDEADERIRDYLSGRCKERPIAWPPAVEYGSQCLPGPNRSAVVSVPTGSGKGFIAEVAIAQAMADGWSLYLVPTNALASQVIADLEQAFSSRDDITVHGLFGGQEFSPEGHAGAVATRSSVMVVTPEKCAFLLRSDPALFADLRLLVFDECHLLGDSGGRGSLAELVVAEVAAAAPDVRFLLMSAMLEASEVLSDWLETITGRSAVGINSAWRPTRTMRGFVGVASADYRRSARVAARELETLPDGRVNQRFAARYRAVLGLNGTFEPTSGLDYYLLDPPVSGAPLRVNRSRDGEEWSYSVDTAGWVNSAATDWAAFMVDRGESALVFLSRSRHDVFNVGSRIQERAEQSVPTVLSESVEDLLTLATYELGVESQVGDLLRSGVAVHSSALIDEEREAAESAFRLGSATVMLATGTLSQGLNFPASVAIVAGTDVGGRQRSSATTSSAFLNAMGRAGRAMVSAHGLALVIGNQPVAIGRKAGARTQAVGAAPFLAQEDAGVVVSSQLLPFMSRVARDDLVMEGLTYDEMTAVVYAPRGSGRPTAGSVFGNTLAASTVGIDDVRALGEQSATAVEALAQNELRAARAPEWVLDAAALAGVPLPIIFALHAASEQRPISSDDTETMVGWLRRLVALLAISDRTLAATALFGSQLLGGSPDRATGWSFEVLSLPDRAGRRGDAWRALMATLHTYMVDGGSLADVAAAGIAGLNDSGSVDTRRTSGGQPLPRTISMIRKLTERLSLLAGGLAALHVVATEDDPDNEPWSLGETRVEVLGRVPAAIRAGCATNSSLAWHSRVRRRRLSHLLATAAPIPSELTWDGAQDWVREQDLGLIEMNAPLDLELTADERTAIQSYEALRSR